MLTPCLVCDPAAPIVSARVPCLPPLRHRETHHISGAAVKMAEDRGVSLSSLSVADLQSIHPLFDEDVVKVGAAAAIGATIELAGWG